MRRLARAALAAAILVCTPVARASEEDAGSPQPPPPHPDTVASQHPPQAPPPEPPGFLVDRLASGVSVGWYSSKSLRYLTSMHFDFPYYVSRHKGLYVRGSLASSISRIESQDVFRFKVEDVDYLFETGARDYLTPRIAVAAFIGQQGSENLDRPGSARARYIGLGAQSSTFPRPGGDSRFDWNLNVGGVFETQAIDAHWMVRGDALWDAVRIGRSAIGADLSFDSLIEAAGQWRTDWWIGPRWSFDLSNGIRASLFARYLNSRNPLGVGASGLHVGFSYSEGAYRGQRQGRFPDVRGLLAAGYGGDRSPATFDVQSIFPPFRIASRPARAAIGVNASTVVGVGPDEVWYDLSGGVECDLSEALTAVAGVRHRAFHVLAESSGLSRDLNLLDAAVRSAGWEFADRTPGQLVPESANRWPGRLDWTAGASWVISTTVAGNPRWLGTAGLRWSLPAVASMHPFLLAEGGFGEVGSSRYAAGVALPIDMTISAEYRRENILAGDRHTRGIVFSLYF